MLRTLLVSLDGSSASQSALELGMRWAKQFDAMLVGIGIVNQPALTRPEPTPLGASGYKRMRDEARIEEGRRQMDQLLGHFTLQCAQAGIAAKILEDFGQPAEQILLESQRYDLILIGRETRWNWKASIDAEQTQLRLIQHSPRPVVIVPQHIPLHANILIAYDGSLPAARAIAAFQASHLGESHLIHILSVSEDVAVAARSAERASDYLTHHGLTSTSHRVVSSHPATAILEFAAKIQAGLLVMGAYGKPLLHDFFLGSTTRDLIAKSTAPIFLCH